MLEINVSIPNRTVARLEQFQSPQLPIQREPSSAVSHGQVIIVARDRDSDSERLFYFGRVSFLFFFRPPNFRRPWAYFRETLPHDAVCAEIVYVL